MDEAVEVADAAVALLDAADLYLRQVDPGGDDRLLDRAAVGAMGLSQPAVGAAYDAHVAGLASTLHLRILPEGVGQRRCT